MSLFAQLLNGQTSREIGQIIKTLIQKQLNKDLTNTDIVDTENKTPVKLSLTKNIALTTDYGIQSLFEIAELYTPKYTTVEPDDDICKLLLRFENAGRLKDYSLAQDPSLSKDERNIAFAVGKYNLPGLFPLETNDNFMKTEMFSYYNGATHFAYVKDKLMIQLKRICIDNSLDISFFLRMKPMSLGRQIDREATTIFTKVDDDQLRYGYGCTIDTKGHMHFYIRNNYTQYHLWIKNAYSNIFLDPVYQDRGGFSLESFNKLNFQTDYQYLCSVVKNPLLKFDDWFLEYDTSNNEMKAILNGLLHTSSTTSPTTKPYLSLPMQEGKWIHTGITQQTTLYDNSGNNNNATISNIGTGGVWNDDNTLTSNGLVTGSLESTLPNIAALNTLTEFSVAFWFNPMSNLVPSHTEYVIHKGVVAAQTFLIYRNAGANDIRFVIYNTSTSDYQQAIFDNAFPDEDKWYLVVAKWKSGEKVKLSVNNSTAVQSAANLTMTLTNASTVLKIGRTVNGPTGIIALFKFYTTQIDQTTQDELYEQAYHNPSFPKSEAIQPVVDESPDPVFIPYSVFYILGNPTGTLTSGNYRFVNALSGDNPFVELYNCADGVETSDPEALIYDVADGVSSGGGVVEFTSQYNCVDPGTNSFVQLSESQDNAAAAVEVLASSPLIGQKVTKAIFRLRGVSTPTGNARCKVWNASNVLVTTLWYEGVTNQALSAASIRTDDYDPYTFQNTDVTPYGANTIQVGWKIGIEYDEGDSTSDQINVQRDTANPIATARQASRDYSGDWQFNASNDIVCQLFSGGTGTATSDPFIYMEYVPKIGGGSSNTYLYDRIMEKFGSGDTDVLTKVPTKMKFKLKKVGSPTGTLHCYLKTAYNGTTLAEFSSAITVSSIPTTTTEYTFSNLSNVTAISTNYVIMLVWESSNQSGKIGILTNDGASDPHNGTSSYIQKYGYIPGFESFGPHLINYTSIDFSGKIYKGGNSFNPWNRFSPTKQHIGLKVVNINSSLHGDKVTKVIARMKKTGSPTGIMTCSIKDGITFDDKAIIGQFDVSTMTAGVLQDVPFIKSTNTYLLGENDRIAFTYSGSDGTTNYVEINTNQNIKDGLNTIMYQVDGAETSEIATNDLAGIIYTGGEPDQNSRTRVVQSIEHQNSIIKGKKITKVIVKLYRTTIATTGTVYCSLYRGSDGQLIKTLESGGNPGYAVSSLSTNPAAPTTVIFEDTNNYPMTVGDKIAILFNGGNSTDKVGVLVRASAGYDGSNSWIRKYDEVDYDDSEPTVDLVGEMYEGGFDYTPPEGVEPDPTPVNDKDLIICAGNNKTSGFFECLLEEFRIYSKLVTEDEATNLIGNRYTIGQLGKNEILTPFTLKATGLDG